MVADTQPYKVWDTDDASDYAELMRMIPSDFVQALPRRELYGSPQADELGLTPVEAVPDVLILPDQYDEKIKEAHDQQNMPVYHMRATWRPPGYKYNQNGIGYCWTWGGTGCLMTTRACEDKDTVFLAPVSMGYLVGWADRGNYLGSFIQGAREQGICPAVDGNMNDLRRSASVWNAVGRRDEFKLDLVWDTRSSAMKQHCVSILCYGRSLYVAYNWWGHAVELVGILIRPDGTWEWWISNSHNEPDIIVLTGSRSIPSEAYGFISTVMAA